MGRRAGLLILLFGLGVVVCAERAAAGTATDLRGRVTGRGGEPLPGATITVRNETLAVGERGAITDATGSFRVFRLPPGKGYRVRVTLATYAPVEFTDLELIADRPYDLDVVLRPASDLQETIRVQGHADLVDTESVVTSTTFSSEFLAGLPVLGRDYQDVLSLAPGVTDVDGSGNPNIHGARDTDVITLVDGVSTTDPFTGYYGQQMNIESIEQLEVITSAATAEFSRAQGGFANIITKSGGNDFQGSFKLFVRTDRLDGDGAGIDPTELQGGIGEEGGLSELQFTDLYPFLSFSGPVVRDRLWYYLANEYVQVETPVNAVSQSFVTRTQGYRVFGKMTWQVTTDHKLSLSLTLDRTQDENQGLTSRTEIEAGFTFVRGGPTYTLKETAVLGPTRLLETSLSWFDNSFQRVPTLDPDTNHNGILFIDDRLNLGGNGDGLYQARERDPGEDFDRDRAYDLFEDYNHNNRLDYGEDRDQDLRVTPPGGCEGVENEDVNCNGLLDQEYDLNENGRLDPDEDLGIEGREGTAGNGQFDSEDINRNNLLDTIGDSGTTSFPFWTDRNGNRIRDVGEYRSPLFPDRDYTRSTSDGRISGPNPFEYSDHRSRFTLREDFSLYFDDLGGTHDLKAGAVYEREAFGRNTTLRPVLEIRLRQGLSDSGTLQSGGTVVAHLPTLNSVNNTAEGNNLGLYLQDTYKPRPNLTLGLGLRVDFEDLTSFGHTHFDPAEERRQFDALMALTEVESEQGADGNYNGVFDVGLAASDPLYNGPVPSGLLHLAQITDALKSIAPRRMTRHEYLAEVQSIYLQQVLGREVSFEDLLESGFNARGEDSIHIQNVNVAPRISLTWDPWADGRSKAFASWNRFYDKLFLNTVVLEEGPDTVTRYYAFDANGVDNRGLPNNQIGFPRSFAPPTAFQVDRRLSTPYTDEFSAGFERELAPEFSLSITYIRRDYRNQLQNVDANHSTRIDPRTGRFQDLFGIELLPGGFGNDVSGRGVRSPDGKPDLYINNLFFNRVYRLGNYNQQHYQGLELEVVRRLSRKWQLEGSYTYSRSEGEAESFLSDNGDDPTLTEFEPGYLNFDQRHVVKLNAIAFLPGDWQIGGTAQWASGLPYSFMEEFDAQDNVGYVQSRRRFGSTDPYLGFQSEQRNSHRNPAAYLLNARAKKNFVMGKTTAAAFFEVYNLLNTDDLRVYSIDPSRFSLSAEQERAFGRRYQVGLQLDF